LSLLHLTLHFTSTRPGQLVSYYMIGTMLVEALISQAR
jgi:hypothetical protein